MATFFFCFILFLLHSAAPLYSHSPFFNCGVFGEVGFPFTDTSNSDCGSIILNCTSPDPIVKFRENGRWFLVEFINYSLKVIVIQDQDLHDQLISNHCDSLKNFTDELPVSTSFEFNVTSPVFPFFKCKREKSDDSHDHDQKLLKSLRNFTDCVDNYDLYFTEGNKTSLPLLTEPLSHRCSTVDQLPPPWIWDPSNSSHQTRPQSQWDPGNSSHGILPQSQWDPSKPSRNLSDLWDDVYLLRWEILPAYVECHKSKGGLCLANPNGSFLCGGLNRKGMNKGKKITIGLGTAFSGITLASVLLFLYERRKRLHSASATSMSWSSSPECSLKEDVGKCSMSLRAPIFTYNELEEATNNFDPLEELGDGGFGTVYHGKLQDGRDVAVKRLFKNKYKRVEMFMNEVMILSKLRHPNLVALYGCTSRHCRELLLVYEFVPNGTVADHLHGEHAKAGLLTWPFRMTIAIETAEALAYLHASDIIHRDVKTNNILLHKNFHVKVADFGLSRLFPNDVTHVSTAPQGTPGYVDPEYYRCYQLNAKSDVYSFGVVLIELISSKPAVDISRHRSEINLASMAISKILNHALHELVDPNLGFDSDYAVKRMISLVAELAFRCLQQENEMRPTMKEVLESLKKIENEKYNIEEGEELDVLPEMRLLKGTPPFSLDSVMNKCASISTTRNTSV